MTMKLTVNGKEVEGTAGATILDLLKEHNLECDRVVVEVNGQIVRREGWGDTPLREKDSILLLSFVGGG